MAKARGLNVSIIGAGTVGSTLARALFDHGYHIVTVISRTGSSAIALAKSVKCKKASTSVADIHPETDIIIIAVSDNAMTDVIKELSSTKTLQFKKLFITHTSGVYSVEVLTSLKRKGAAVASIHPIQSFPKYTDGSKGLSQLRGIYYGIDGESRGLQRAEKLVNDLRGKIVIIPQELKPLYHLICVFASGYMMVFLNTISELSRMLKLRASWTEVFGPLMTTAMENTVKHSAENVLTGPLARGDLSTIELHLMALSQHAPQFLPLYTINGIEFARIAKKHGRISQQEFDQILSRFKKFIKSYSVKKISKVIK